MTVKRPTTKGTKKKPQNGSPKQKSTQKKRAAPVKKAPTKKKGSGSSKMTQLFPIVAVGASAGGLEAMERFFKGIPPESGMSFVVVQHLDPSHKSILAELVRRVTPMEVHETTDNIEIAQNSVYIIPPNRDMGILHGSLQLIEPVKPRGLRLPIDYFFRSFATDSEERSICVILSGTGTDGTLGLKAVKEIGGMVIVQEPESAKYDGMPRSAIGTGLVDLVLRPEEMGSQLLRYVGQITGIRTKQPYKSPPYKESDLKKVYVLLRNQTGHDFSFYKPNTILRRIERRLNINQIDTLKEYIRFLQRDSLEVETLFKELLIGVSNFFRDPEAFQSLQDKIIPKLFDNRSPDDAIRVWTTGCATGEEAYSIAILLREEMEKRKQEVRLQVFATDLDSSAIETARSGCYPDSIAADVTTERLKRFFTKHDNTYQVIKSIRDILVFAEQNVIKDPPFSRMDLITCRNLLIYLEGGLQKRLMPLFHYALRQNGVLFLGNSESIGDATDLFSVVDRKWKIFKRKGSSSHHGLRHEPISVPFPLDMPNVISRDNDKPLRAPSFREITEGVLLKDHAPPCVLVTEKGEGLFFHGVTGKYLQPPTGEPNLNILGLARKGLELDLSTALRKVAANKLPVCYKNVNVKTNGSSQLINLTVKPVVDVPGQGTTILVLFEDVVKQGKQKLIDNGEPSGAKNKRVVELERELRSTREYLQTTIEELETSNEELKSTNEELQSANEELQSTNEELETSKEELQSVNEELVTVNGEHEVKLDELSKVSNDMTNLLSSTNIGTIFLDINLRIQRFTPKATDMVKLIPTDVGRPLTDIVTNFIEPAPFEGLSSVLETLIPSDKEAQVKNGSWYSFRTRPYRTVDNVIEGIVITFVDITDIKKVQEELLMSNDRFNATLRISPLGIIIANTDHNLRYTWISNIHADFKDSDVIGKTDIEVLDNDSSQKLFALKKQVFKSGVGTEKLIKFIMSTGDITYRVSAEPLRNSNEEIIGVTTASIIVPDKQKTT
jgi:two-component system, chemotaxis family, CheB/CheR fusion protein